MYISIFVKKKSKCIQISFWQKNSKKVTFLNQECPFSKYGQDCLYNCSGNCQDGIRCNLSTGRCDNGCEAGFTGERCDKGMNIQIKSISVLQNDNHVWFYH